VLQVGLHLFVPRCRLVDAVAVIVCLIAVAGLTGGLAGNLLLLLWLLVGALCLAAVCSAVGELAGCGAVGGRG
jgi:hypothetical protein